MRRLLLLSLAAAGIVAAQCPTGFVSVTGALSNPNGSPYDGSLSIALAYNTTAGGNSVRAGTVKAQSVRGFVTVSGAPLCLAPGNYTVNSSPGGITYWTVPSSGPVTITGIEGSGPVSPTLSVSAAQVAPGANGTFLATYGGASQWAAAPGLLAYSRTVTSQTTVTVSAAVHGLPGANLIAVCAGVAECGAVNVAGNGTVTVTSAVPWSGTLYILASNRNYSLPFTATMTASALFPLHGLHGEVVFGCYDSSGNQFGSGPLSLALHDLGITGSQGADYTITLGGSNQTGRCVFLGY